MTNLKCSDVKDLNDKFLVSIRYNKNDYAGQFIIGPLFYDKIKQYISLRPTYFACDRFFIQYIKGKCTRQPMGKHKIAEVPENIATYLNLDNPKRYTGHCFRRTSATLLSQFGAHMQTIKQLGRWRSDAIAQGYIEKSLRSKKMIYHGIIHESVEANSSRPSTSVVSTTVEIHPIPSTSTAPVNGNRKPESNFNLDWSDFSEEFTINSLPSHSSISKNVEEPAFLTGNKKRILVPHQTNQDNSIKKMHFSCKPPVTVRFNQSPASKVKKTQLTQDVHIQDENFNSVISNITHAVKFENCTFTNCVFIIDDSKCDK